MGRLDPEKAPHLLIEMMDVLAARDPARRYRLTIVGTGRLEDEIADMAARREDRVRMLGYLPFGPALMALYRESDVFVHTARTEGSPQVLVEAQSEGLPIVATDVGGVAAALGGGAAGVLVAPGRADRLAEAVVRLVSDEAMRERLAAAGRACARSNTIEYQADRVARFLAG